MSHFSYVTSKKRRVIETMRFGTGDIIWKYYRLTDLTFFLETEPEVLPCDMPPRSGRS